MAGTRSPGRTFHALPVGSTVPIEFVRWRESILTQKIIATFQGTIVENDPQARCLKADILDCTRTYVTGEKNVRFAISTPGIRIVAVVFSKRTGVEWGWSSIENGCFQLPFSLAACGPFIKRSRAWTFRLD